MQTTKTNRILVVRNDKLGDLMLAWPAFAALKRSLSDCEVHALVSGYTADITRLCPDLDHVIIDPGADADAAAQQALLTEVRNGGYDAAITLFSTTRIGWLLFRASIPVRVAPATKLAQFFHNRRLTQRRSRSEKPEFAYNVDLVRHYLAQNDIACREGTPPWLTFPANDTDALRRDFCREHGIDPAGRVIFLHPGSGGSASNLGIDRYARLAGGLTSSAGHHVVISAGPGEIDQARSLAERIDATPCTVYHSTEGLERFARHIAFCDLFIGGSTGPLHIAGALDRNTAAFYPRRRSSTALRWQTINRADRQLAFSPPDDAEENDMTSIDVERAAVEISERFLGQPR